jgi:post-segregation antitoxin (ccd killing protein)
MKGNWRIYKLKAVVTRYRAIAKVIIIAKRSLSVRHMFTRYGKLYIVYTQIGYVATETVSFRIKKELKDLAKKHKMDISKIAREKVEAELEKLEKKEREEIFENASAVLKGVTKQDIVAAVRKGRESR